jgi:hypothetical protein
MRPLPGAALAHKPVNADLFPMLKALLLKGSAPGSFARAWLWSATACEHFVVGALACPVR